MASLTLAIACTSAVPPRLVNPNLFAIGRRSVLAAAAAATIATPVSPSIAAQLPETIYTKPEEVPWGPAKGLTSSALETLETLSMAPDAGTLLPSGVRVIDLVKGDGPQPKRGDMVYCQVKSRE